MHVLLMVALGALAASLLFGVLWAAVGLRLGGGPAERERQLREGPGTGPAGQDQSPPEVDRQDPQET